MKKILSLTRKAINDFDLIQEGDKIAVGISGGKDSLVTLVALSSLQKWYPVHFDLCAITIDIFDGKVDFGAVQKLCDNLGIEYHIVNSKIYEIVFEERKEKNPCSLCAKMRRGALCGKAVELGFNKIALGHHSDDLIETFFLSMFFEGRLSSFAPKSFMDKTKITLIRPMLYVDEYLMTKASADLPVVKNNCPANHNTKRELIKKHIQSIKKDIPFVKERIFGALTSPERYNLFDNYKKGE